MFFHPSFMILLLPLTSLSYKRNSVYRHVYKERLLFFLASCVMLARLERITLPNINYPNNMLLLNYDAAILQKSCGKIWLAARYQRVKRSRGWRRKTKGREIHMLLFVVALCNWMIPLKYVKQCFTFDYYSFMCVYIQMYYTQACIHTILCKTHMYRLLARIIRSREIPNYLSPSN